MWLFKEVIGAQFGCAYRSFNGAVAGYHDDFRSVLDFADLLQGIQTIHARQPNIKKDGVEDPLAEQFKASFTTVGRLGLVAFVLENALQRLPNRRFIIYDENIMHAGR